MKTNTEFVSRVAGELKALTKDGRISRRLILSAGQDKARFLMGQKLDEMTLFREDGIISTIHCFELETVAAVECDIVDLRHCKSVMKSIKKIPEGIFGKNGSGILYVYTVDESQKFEYTNPRRYKDIKLIRHLRQIGNYYTIKNGYLYLPDSEVEVVGIQMIALFKYQANEASSCCETNQKCQSYWDYEFMCPDRFYDLVVKDTLTELANIYRTSVEDSNPNLDVNQKGKTTE